MLSILWMHHGRAANQASQQGSELPRSHWAGLLSCQRTNMLRSHWEEPQSPKAKESCTIEQPSQGDPSQLLPSFREPSSLLLWVVIIFCAVTLLLWPCCCGGCFVCCCLSLLQKFSYFKFLIPLLKYFICIIKLSGARTYWCNEKSYQNWLQYSSGNIAKPWFLAQVMVKWHETPSITMVTKNIKFKKELDSWRSRIF